jgi:outer membrane protein
MITKKHCIIALTLLLTSATNVSAQTDPLGAAAEVWTYQQCIDYARDNNISLQQSRLAESSADYTLEAAKAQWTPSVEFATSHNYGNTPFASSSKNSYNSSYGVNASWTVWDGGVRSGNIARERLNVEKQQQETTTIYRSLQTNILSLYLNILYLRETITINEEAAKVSQAQAERAKSLMDSGRLSRVDYTQLESQAEQDRYNIVSARANYDTQLMQLKKLLELGIARRIDVQSYDWTESDVLAAPPSLEESYELALATDSELKAAQLASEVADKDVDIAKAGYYPNISLNANVGASYYAPGGIQGWTESMKKTFGEQIGVSISVPIYDRKSTRTAVSKARIQQLNSQLDQESRRNELAQAVEGCYIDLYSAQRRYTAGLEQLNSANLSEELINERFNVGYVEVTELLQSHSTALAARHELLQAKYMAMLSQKMIEYYRTTNITMP